LESTVCRVSNRDLIGDDDILTAQDGLTDEEMFNLANTDGSGQMTLAQFATYLGGSENNEALVAKFHA
jgi:hypothetical protein